MTTEQKKAMSKRMKQYHKANRAGSDKQELALNLLKTVVKLLGGK